jgi:hypothetical protein
VTGSAERASLAAEYDVTMGNAWIPPSWLAAWLPLCVSTVSLAISGATFWLTQRRPRVQLILPNRVRVSAASDASGAFVYIQPVFVNTARSARAEVVLPALTIIPVGGSPAEFEYFDKSRPVWDSERREVHVEYLDEATPVIIGPNTVKAEMLTFRSNSEWQFVSGWYTCVFSVTPLVGRRRLAKTFQLVITDEHRRVWSESGGKRFVMVQTLRTCSA